MPIGQRYAEIDVQPGYQRLCGQHALDYVRFRHLDNDIVRADRQQDFLREASAQVSTSSLLRNLNPLVKAFAKSTSSDANLQTSRGILRLLRLAASSAGRAVRQVRFPHTFVQSTPAAGRRGAPARRAPSAPIGLGDYVTATPEQIQRAVSEFMHPRAARPARPSPPAPKKRQRQARARVSAASYGLVPALPAAKAIVRPALAHGASSCRSTRPAWLTPQRPLPGEHGRRARSRACTRSPTAAAAATRPTGSSSRRTRRRGSTTASRARAGSNPPILDGPHPTQRMAGRSYRVYYDGAHIRLVAWHTPRGVYWVSNSPQPRALQPRDARHRALAHAHPRG